MQELIGKKVSVYFNLHKKLWSIKYKGKVVAHVPSLQLKPTKFHVGESSRAKIVHDFQTTGKRTKHIHAWINGEIISFNPPKNEGAEISYNPYFAGHYYDRKNNLNPINPDNYTYLDFNHSTRYVYGK